MKRRAVLYLRVSTRDQTLANQLPDLERVAAARDFEIVRTYQDEESGVKRRPELERLIGDAHAHRFDVVLVWALDRFGRNMGETVAHVLELERIGVDVLSAREPWLDTAGPARSLLVSVFAWVAERERSRLVERTHAGLERARAAGVKLGRPRVSVSLAELEQLIAAKLSPRAMAKRLHCSRASVYRQLAAIGLATKAERRGYRLTNGGSKSGS